MNYTEKVYQFRFTDIPPQSNDGYWCVPNNKLPTTQFIGLSDDLTKITITKTVGQSDISSFDIPVGNATKKCLTSGATIYYFNDSIRDFTIDPGTYFATFEFDSDSDKVLYSEEWKSGGDVCCNYPVLVLDSASIGPGPAFEGTANFSLSSVGTTPVVELKAVVDGGDEFPPTFSVMIDPDTTKDITVTLETLECGTYTQVYELEYIGSPTNTIELIKIYP